MMMATPHNKQAMTVLFLISGYRITCAGGYASTADRFGLDLWR
jgi:hypothetical protein